MKPVSSGMRSGIEVLYGCWQVGSLTIEGVEATVLTGCVDCMWVLEITEYASIFGKDTSNCHL